MFRQMEWQLLLDRIVSYNLMDLRSRRVIFMKKTVYLLAIVVSAILFNFSGCNSSSKKGGATVAAGLTNPASLILVNPPSAPFTSVTGDNVTDTGSNFFIATNYGASTGNANNASNIQAAVTAATAYATPLSPGIVVLNGGGTYMSGPITLASNVYLKIETGTTLKALSMTAYAATYGVTLDSTHTTGSGTKTNFVTASDCSNLGIIGTGIIDGNGGNGSSVYATFSADTTCWWGYYKTYSPGSDPRPRAVYFTRCTNLLVQGITIQNSPSMAFMTSGGSNIVVSGITINAPAKTTTGDKGNGTTGDSPNTDGFDPGGSSSQATSNIWVDNCTFDTGDDCIAVKAASTLSPSIAVTGLYITNCTFYHGHGLSFGGQTQYGVSNVIVNNCTFYGTQYGIKIKSPRGTGGPVHDIQYSNITMTNVDKPIWFTGYYSDSQFTLGMSTDTVDPTVAAYTLYGTPYYYNILVQNLSVTGTVSGAVSTVGEVLGLLEMPFTNIVLQGITVTATGSAPLGLWVRNATVFTNGNTYPTPRTSTIGGVVTPY